MLKYVALILAALTFAPAFAHLAEMPAKLKLDGEAWYATQFLYQGWGAWLGPIEGVTLLVTAWWLWEARSHRPALATLTIALASYVGMQLCFWFFNFPVNAAVASWNSATLPADWFAYRARWEWSHAARAVLAFIAFVCLLRAALVGQRFRAP
jgi:hypothetical protein